MSMTIRPAQAEDVPHILQLVNHFAAQNVMLPRTEESIQRTLDDWLVVVEEPAIADSPPLVGCGALVPLTDTLAEVRSLAIHDSQHGKGIGSLIVQQLVDLARAREYHQVCALTLRENFFIRLGFQVVDRWSISPKVWQACIYCPKFHRCDEVAVLMNLTAPSAEVEIARPGWRNLLKYQAWQPLKLAYRVESTVDDKVAG